MGQQRGLCFSNGSFSSSCLNTSERETLWGLIEQLCVISVLSDSAARAGSALYPCEAISTKQEAKEVDKAQRRQMPRPETFAKIDECLRRRNAFAFVAADLAFLLSGKHGRQNPQGPEDAPRTGLQGQTSNDSRDRRQGQGDLNLDAFVVACTSWILDVGS